jgi:thiamine pyrophosphate-dependent acetolactate synthase large subunit-like protein
VQDLFGQLSKLDRSGVVSSRIPASTRVVHYTLEGLNVRSLISDYQRLQPEDLRVAADTARALPSLVERCRERLKVESSARRDLRAERRATLANKHHQLRAKWQESALAERDQQPLSTAATALALWDAIGRGRNAWLLANGTMNGWARKLWTWDKPNLFLGRSGGAGLGYGIGAAVGGALAHRDKETLVVNIQSDGDMLFSPGALWTLAHHQIPMLTVMWNNRSYYNSEEHAIQVARARKRPVEQAGIGTQITDPNVDYAQLARSLGVHGEGPVESFAELQPALERAVKIVTEERRPALVDVVAQAR